MTSHASPISVTSPSMSQMSVISDLVAMWSFLTAALVYMDVSLRYAALFAIALVLQACLGVQVITRLFKGVLPSLLLLCGPGLVLGGALSLAVFQISGRGVRGTAASVIVNLIVLVALVRKDRWGTSGPRWWIVGQLLGMTALALITEFAELLPVAVLFFTVGFISDPARLRPRWSVALTVPVSVIVILVSFVKRQNYWWLVTDDYMFFEVISRHITVSGPIADWGVHNFARYHWLSYGWAGLLNLLGGSPEPFVTLTRVMPLVYSLSLAASLVLLGKQLSHQNTSMVRLIPVWAVIAISNLDWSGTSTAGVYAVLAAVGFLLSVASEQPRLQASMFLLIAMFMTLLILTKLPSIFAGLLLAAAVSIGKTFSRLHSQRQRNLVVLGVVTVTCSLALVSIWISCRLFDLPFRFVAVNPALGQLSWFGKDFLFPALVLDRLWLWVVVVAAASFVLRRSTSASNFSHMSITASLAALLTGVVLEMTLTGNMDNHKYFSQPMYFLASFTLLSIPNFGGTRGSTRHGRLFSQVIPACSTAAGLAWGQLNFAGTFWDFVNTRIVESPSLAVELLRFVTNDSRFIVAVLTMVLVLFGKLFVNSLTFTNVLLFPLVLLTLADRIDESRSDYSRVIDTQEVEEYLGGQSEEQIGRQLRQVTSASEMHATNHIIGEDFALAAWSEREFLLLGTRFFTGDAADRDSAFALSTSFADSPDERKCKLLRELGVRWFVVDLTMTAQRDWSVCGKKSFAYQNYIVLALMT